MKGVIATLIFSFLFISFLYAADKREDSLVYKQKVDSFLVCYNNGRYRKAIPKIKGALKIAERLWGQYSENYIKSYDKLCYLNVDLGRYKRALRQFGKLENFIDSTLPEKHRLHTTYLNNLAGIYMQIGFNDKALRLLNEAYNIFQSDNRFNHPLCAAVLNNKGNIFEKKGKVAKALPLYQKAHQINYNSKRNDNDQGVIHITDLADAHFKLGNKAKAEKFYQKAISIFRDSLSTSHPYFGKTLRNLGRYYQKNKAYQKALSLFKKALSHTKKQLSENHPRYIACLNDLAGCHSVMQHYRKAFDYHQQIQNHIREQITQKFSFLNQKEKAQYLLKINRNFEQFQSFGAKASLNSENLAGLAYNNELLRKGLVLNQAKKLREEIKKEAGKALMRKYKQWKRVNNAIARQYALPSHKRRKNLDSVKQLANRLERELIRQSDEFREEQMIKDANWQEVRKALDPHEVAIEFISFRHWENGFKDSTIYGALLLKKGAKPDFISLFPESELSPFLEKPTNGSEKTYINDLYSRNANGSKLYKLIWSKLEPHLKNINNIYYTPAGSLHQVSLNAIPHPEESYLSRKYNLVRLNSTRKLVEQPSEPDHDSIALFGGIRYEFDTAGKNQTNTTPQLVMKDLEGYQKTRSIRGKFDFLDGSLKEVQSIDEIIGKKATAKLYTGHKAKESSFKELGSNGPQVLHLATHGFCFPDRPDTTTEEEKSKLVFKHAKNPMLRSGLALAGSNYAWQHGYNPYQKENGILTGYEIANMDLFNTDLVVLSGCETGLGEIKGSEGVYGLQRAFKMAGVEYLIMSLWKVPDKQTRMLMTKFYDHWYSGQSIRQAFQNAQQALAREYPPYFWSGFVLIGGNQVEAQIPDDQNFLSSWSLAGGSVLVIILIFLFLFFRTRFSGKVHKNLSPRFPSFF